MQIQYRNEDGELVRAYEYNWTWSDRQTLMCNWRPSDHPNFSQSARLTLEKLKKEHSVHIEELHSLWIDICGIKEHENPSIFRDIGFMITMPTKFSQAVLKMVKEDDEDLLAKVKSKPMMNLVNKLKKKPTKYLEDLEEVWKIMDYRKSYGQGEVMMRLYVQLGLLMQTRDDEVKEMFRILKKMIEDGKIEDGTDSDTIRTKLHPLSYWYPELKKKQSVQEASNQAKVTPTPPPRNPARGPRYIPRVGEWQCAICKFWNKPAEPKCVRKRTRGLKTCKGTKGASCAKVQH